MILSKEDVIEKALTNKILKALNALRGVLAYKRMAVYNEVGKPDITGVVSGIRLEIEVKRPSLMPSQPKTLRGLETKQIMELFRRNLRLASKIQQYHIRKFYDYGCLTGVALSVEQAVYLVNNRLEEWVLLR